MTKRRETITDKIEEFLNRYEEIKKILSELKNCSEPRCMLERAVAVVEAYKLIDKLLYKMAFVASGVGGAEVAKLFEDVILMMSKELAELGIYVDLQKWSKALADTARYRARKLDGVNVSDVRKESNSMYI